MSEAPIVSIERLKSIIKAECEEHNNQYSHKYDPNSIAYRFELEFICKKLSSKADPMTMTSWEEDFDKAWSERDKAFLFVRMYFTRMLIMAIFKEEGKADNLDKNVFHLAHRFAFSIIPPLAKHYGFTYIHIQMRPPVITYGYAEGDEATVEDIDYTTMLRKDINETYCEWTEAEIDRTTIEKITEGDVEDPDWVKAEYERSCEAAAKFYEDDEGVSWEDLRQFWEARYSIHPQRIKIMITFSYIIKKKLDSMEPIIEEVEKEARAMLAAKFMEIGNQGRQGK
jgi:hypothetical protein